MNRGVCRNMSRARLETMRHPTMDGGRDNSGVLSMKQRSGDEAFRLKAHVEHSGLLQPLPNDKELAPRGYDADRIGSLAVSHIEALERSGGPFVKADIGQSKRVIEELAPPYLAVDPDRHPRNGSHECFRDRRVNPCPPHFLAFTSDHKGVTFLFPRAVD